MSATLESTERFVWGEAKRGDALGSHQLWGWSPALDVLSPLPASVSCTSESTEPIRVLLASPGDVRGVLRTLAKRRSGDESATKMSRPIHFYVHEESVEILGRHLLLLRVAQDWELPLRQRAAVWMELYGNALVQERTETYLSRLAAELVDLVGESGDCGLSDLVDLSKLKFRERDVMASTFGSWRTNEAAFPLADLWDRRLRALLGARYDHMDSNFDWDYRSGLSPSSEHADLVHLKMYRRWRKSGVAFEFGDQVYEKANRTLGTYVDGFLKHGKNKGCKREVRGYWGDMVIGPYVGMGVETDPGPLVDDLLYVQDKGHGTEQRRHNATEVFMYNLLSYLFAIETGADYAMSRKNDIFSGLGNFLTKDRDALAHAEAIVETFDGVKIFPMTGDFDTTLAKTNVTFDVAHISVSAAQKIKSDALKRALKPDATVHVETAQFLVPLKPKEKQIFADKVHEWGLENGWLPLYKTKKAADETATVISDSGLTNLNFKVNKE